MLFHDALDDGQPQPGALGAGGEEGLENLRHLFAVDAPARVGNRNLHGGFLAVHDQVTRDGDLAAGRRRLDCVVDEVAQDFRYLDPVAMHQGDAAAALDDDVDVLVGGHVGQRGHRLVDDPGQLVPVRPQALGPGETQHVAHDLFHVTDLAQSHVQVFMIRVVGGVVAARQDLQVHLDGRQRIAQIVGDHARHPAHGGQALGVGDFAGARLDFLFQFLAVGVELVLAVRHAARHVAELVRQIADFIVALDRQPPVPVAVGEAPDFGTEFLYGAGDVPGQ